ncbi:hypothetical protein [Bacteroides heparinolyticus]|uniref:hypothetical protein n=1 Tax=Prevotella heparinolytica TaxID=28113 RepID=UPI00359F820C
MQALSALNAKDKLTLRKRIEKAKNVKKPRRFVLFFTEIYEILRLTNRLHMLYSIVIVSVVLGFAGFLLGSLFGSAVMALALTCVLAMLPFVYIKITAIRYKAMMLSELETALSVITTSYLRGNNSFVDAVEENVVNLNQPIRAIFEEFLMDSKYLSSNLKGAINDLKYSLNNVVFHEWIDAVIISVNDHTQKSTLLAIVNKLSDMRIMTSKLSVIIYEPFREFVLMSVIVAFTPLILKVISKEWFDILMSDLGKAVMGASLVVMLFAVLGAVRQLRPVEYSEED